MLKLPASKGRIPKCQQNHIVNIFEGVTTHPILWVNGGKAHFT